MFADWRSWALTRCRHDGDTVYIGLSIDISFPLSLPVRRRAIIWSDGRDTYTRTTLYPHTAIQPLPSSGTRRERETKIYRDDDQPVSLAL